MASAEPGGSDWSIRIGRVLGFPVRVHVTFLVLLVWFAWTSSERGDNTPLAVAFLLLLFGCVLLHELGHATMARAFGVRTRDIVLYPFGGIARLENIPGGKAELFIALAGPAVNVVLAGLLFAFLVAGMLGGSWGPEDLGEPLSATSALATRLLVANLALFVFNLVPAFPMDGGRVLRALLSLTLSPQLATRIATRVGQGFAVVFAVLGIAVGNPFLVLIGVVVFIGAAQEALIHSRRTVISGKTARDAMVTRFGTLRPQDSLTDAVRLFMDGRQQAFPVIDAWNRPAGVLWKDRLMQELALGEGNTAILEIMERDVPSVLADTPLEAVLDRLAKLPRGPIFVVEEGRLLGLVTLENITQLINAGHDAAKAKTTGGTS